MIRQDKAESGKEADIKQYDQYITECQKKRRNEVLSKRKFPLFFFTKVFARITLIYLKSKKRKHQTSCQLQRRLIGFYKVHHDSHSQTC